MLRNTGLTIFTTRLFWVESRTDRVGELHGHPPSPQRNGKRRDNTFFLELKHECRLLGCPSRCKQDGRVMERVVLQAPTEQRMRQW